MGSTFPSTVQPAQSEQTAIRWRSWPLGDQSRWSWLVIVGILLVSAWSYFWRKLAVGGGSRGGTGDGAVAVFRAGSLRSVGAGNPANGSRPNPVSAVARGVAPINCGRAAWCFISSLSRSRSICCEACFLPYPADEDELICALAAVFVACGGGASVKPARSMLRVGRPHRVASFGSSASRRPSPRKLSAYSVMPSAAAG